MPKPLEYAIVSPSFRLDLDRFLLLMESVERWVAPGVKHYVIVDRRDVPLFRPRLNSRTDLLVVEDIVPRWLIRIPGLRRFWLSLRTRPVKNWILQQIVKLSVPAVIPQDILLYCDSDVFFVAPYDPRDFEREGSVPLFLETGQRGLIENNDRWHAVAARLLGIDLETSYDTNFIGNVICWRRPNVLTLQQRMEEVADNRPWAQGLADLSAFSEYVLYGLHASRLLGPGSGHWPDGTLRTLNYWLPQPLDLAGLQKLQGGLDAHHHSVMISAKSGTAVEDIRRVFITRT